MITAKEAKSQAVSIENAQAKELMRQVENEITLKVAGGGLSCSVCSKGFSAGIVDTVTTELERLGYSVTVYRASQRDESSINITWA